MKEWLLTAVLLAASALGTLLGLLIVVRPKSAFRVLGQYRGEQEDLTALPGWKPAIGMALRLAGLLAAMMGAVVMTWQLMTLSLLQRVTRDGREEAAVSISLLSLTGELAVVAIGLYLLLRPQDLVALFARRKPHDGIQEGELIQARVSLRIMGTMLLLGGLLDLRVALLIGLP